MYTCTFFKTVVVFPFRYLSSLSLSLSLLFCFGVFFLLFPKTNVYIKNRTWCNEANIKWQTIQQRLQTDDGKSNSSKFPDTQHPVNHAGYICAKHKSLNHGYMFHSQFQNAPYRKYLPIVLNLWRSNEMPVIIHRERFIRNWKFFTRTGWSYSLLSPYCIFEDKDHSEHYQVQPVSNKQVWATRSSSHFSIYKEYMGKTQFKWQVKTRLTVMTYEIMWFQRIWKM